MKLLPFITLMEKGWKRKQKSDHREHYVNIWKGIWVKYKD